MKFSPAHYLLPLLPALVLSTRFLRIREPEVPGGLQHPIFRQSYDELGKTLKEIAKERSILLHQMAKNSRELVGIKSNLQSLKNEEKDARVNVQKLLIIGSEQREQLKSLHDTLHIQLKEEKEKVEKQQSTITFLKTELERKSKMIRDLQNENKSLKNKLLAGNKLCGIHAEEAKKIQAQLKDIHYGKKDLLLKAQILNELEQKLIVAKNEMDKAALDKESQMKAMKETIRTCLSTVFRNPVSGLIPLTPTTSNPHLGPLNVGEQLNDKGKLLDLSSSLVLNRTNDQPEAILQAPYEQGKFLELSSSLMSNRTNDEPEPIIQKDKFIDLSSRLVLNGTNEEPEEKGKFIDLSSRLVLNGTNFESNPTAQQVEQKFGGTNENLQYKSATQENLTATPCNPNENRECPVTVEESIPRNDTLQNNNTVQTQEYKVNGCTDCEENKNLEKQLTSFEGRTTREEKIL